ncbi:MAG: hypothetical protein JSV79_05180 [Armatimonadota bacterium]|nr:MAG: hypothetical protein JSV79_05180 [Armatimonadota bacterium]
MRGKLLVKLAIIVPVLIVVVALDTLRALQGVPLLVVALALALLLTERARTWLRGSGRRNVAMLPFMAAALVVLVAFCRGRNPSQLVLFLITLGVVFDVLMVALAAIGEASKRGLKGMFEFVALSTAGLALGLVLSLVFLLEEVSGLGGMGLAKP